MLHESELPKDFVARLIFVTAPQSAQIAMINVEHPGNRSQAAVLSTQPVDALLELLLTPIQGVRVLADGHLCLQCVT